MYTFARVDMILENMVGQDIIREKRMKSTGDDLDDLTLNVRT